MTALLESPARRSRIPSNDASFWERGLVLGAAVYLYAGLFTITGAPFLLGGDQVFFWMNAQRALNGELIYRDFLEVTPPGTDLLYLGAFELFGPCIWVPNLVVLVLGLTLVWLCFHIGSLIIERSQAALASAVFIVVFYGRLLNATHHWLSVLAVMAAIAILMKASTPKRIALAGVLLGIASFFTQTRGIVAAVGIAAYLIWQRFRAGEPWPRCLKRLVLLLLPLAVTWAALSGYFIARTSLGQLWYFQVTYVGRYMISARNIWSVGTAEVLTWLKQPAGSPGVVVYFTLPMVYAICLRKCWRKTSLVNPERIVLLALVGLGMFMEIAQSPSWLRLYCIAMPATILLVRLLVEGAGRYLGVATRLLWIVLIGAACYQTSSRHLRQSMIEDLPAGKVATTPLAAQKLSWLARHTTPGQFVFQAAWPGIYLPLALRNPVFLDNFDTGHEIRPEYLQLSMRQLEAEQVRYILWSPGLESPAYPFAEFRQFLGEHYQPAWTFADHDVLWERK